MDRLIASKCQAKAPVSLSQQRDTAYSDHLSNLKIDVHLTAFLRGKPYRVVVTFWRDKVVLGLLFGDLILRG